MKSLYKPYNFFGKLLWNFWQNSFVFRRMFVTHHIEKVIPIKNLEKHIPSSTVIAYNTGTTGVERKITAVGYDLNKKDIFFLKYGSSQIARVNVIYEGHVLNKLPHSINAPSLLLQIEHPEYSLIKTNFIEGNRMEYKPLNRKILDILIQISKQKIVHNKDFDTDYISCFGHGDFCPWNLIIKDENICIVDWEMAGKYPLGYDLFTYIFQTSFLLNPWTRIQKLIKNNLISIKYYFRVFGETDWKHYLFIFSKQKLKNEIRKNNIKLIKPYQKLKNYSEKL